FALACCWLGSWYCCGINHGNTFPEPLQVGHVIIDFRFARIASAWCINSLDSLARSQSQCAEPVWPSRKYNSACLLLNSSCKTRNTFSCCARVRGTARSVMLASSSVGFCCISHTPFAESRRFQSRLL